MTVPFYIPSKYTKIQFLTSWPTLAIFCFSGVLFVWGIVFLFCFILAILIGVRRQLIVFLIRVSLMISDVEHLFTYLLPICLSVFG